MVTVRTKEELKNALENKETEILCASGSEVAEALRRKKKVKKATKIGGITAIAGGVAAIIGGIAAAPFTGGVSIAGAVAGAGAAVGGAALTAGALTLSLGELALILGFTLAAMAINRHYDVEFNSNGSVKLKANDKQ